MGEPGIATYNGHGRWKNPRLIYQGFEYALVKTTLNVKYYKCHKAKCSGRLNQRGQICTATRGHNMCRPMPNLQREAERVAANLRYEKTNLQSGNNEYLEDTPPPLDVCQDTSNSPRHKLNRPQVPAVSAAEDLQISSLEISKQNLEEYSEEKSGSSTEESVSNEKFEKPNFILPLVWGIKRGLKAKEIVGSSNYSGPIKFLVSWEGTDQMDLVLAEEMNEHFPDVVIAFYEEQLGWNNPKPISTPVASVGIEISAE